LPRESTAMWWAMSMPPGAALREPNMPISVIDRRS
jgi:hypothetical protein